MLIDSDIIVGAEIEINFCETCKIPSFNHGELHRYRIPGVLPPDISLHKEVWIKVKISDDQDNLFYIDLPSISITSWSIPLPSKDPEMVKWHRIPQVNKVEKERPFWYTSRWEDMEI